MSWVYQNTEFDEMCIPDGAVGFVYMMSAIIDGKSYMAQQIDYSAFIFIIFDVLWLKTRLS